MQRYTAITKRGLSITSVYAADEADAKQKIRKELRKNPSRIPYLNQWEKDGELLRENHTEGE